MADQEGLALRGGHHCTQPLLRKLGVPASSGRASPFTTRWRKFTAWGKSSRKCRPFSHEPRRTLPGGDPGSQQAPRNFGPLPDATVTVRGDNPSCGDEIELSLKLNGDQIEDVKFTGQGCAICMASASLLTLKVKKKRKGAGRGAAHGIQGHAHRARGPGVE